MLALKIVGICIVGYLLGNINFAIVISKIMHSDIRSQGSGNPGTMNMLRSYGILPGVICLVFDALKSALPTFFGWWLIAETPFCYTNLLGAYIGGLSAIMGHIFPVFLKFKGGKGVATIIGVSLVLTPIETVAGVAIAIGIILLFKIGVFGSFAAIFIPGIAQSIYINLNYEKMEYLIAVNILLAVTYLLCIYAHRANIVRLIQGKENKVYLLKKKEKEPASPEPASPEPVESEAKATEEPKE